MPVAGQDVDRLRAYVPNLLLDWIRSTPSQAHRQVEGTLAFVDISGFTKLTERLARHGRVGAEELSDALNGVFVALVTVAAAHGGDLVKWGGDAVLMLFTGADHAARGVHAALQMRASLREVGRLETTAGRVTLRMSVGVHSDIFDFFLVGDPDLHRELLVSGPAASETARLEAVATAGQVVVSDRTAALLARGDTTPLPAGGGHLARGPVQAPPWSAPAGVIPQQRSSDEPVAPYLPSEIRRRLLAGSVQPEHRPITVAFVQFSGTDELLRRSDGRTAATALDEMVRNVAGAAAEFGVTFFESDINADGGKIMLTAGAPMALEHAEEHMLRTARRIVERAGTLPVRIGINRGRIFSGDFGPAFRRTYSVKGDAINLAARVMGKAKPGEVLATHEVLRHIASGFERHDLAPFLVKGKKNPVHAAEVGPLLRDGEQPHAPADDGQPMLGREAETALLESELVRSRAGTGRIVEVLGEPGIGKSRLLAELRRTADDGSVVSVDCNEYAVSTPYAAVKELLTEVLGLTDEDAPAVVRARLESAVESVRPGLQPWLPLLGVPLDLNLPETPQSRDLEEQFRGERLEEVTLDLLTGLLTGPALLVVDDAQLMDAASAAFFQRLARGLADRSWLLVVGRRDYPTGFMAPKGTGRQIRLEPLDAEAAVRLVNTATTGRPLPPDAVRALAEQSGGNPMFLASLVAVASRSGSVSELPVSVEGVIAVLVDTLAVDDRLVLRRAAVLGTVFEPELLARVLVDAGESVDDDRLQRLADFLAFDNEGRLRFRHALLREVAYAGLPYRQRTRLHAVAAEAVEATGSPHENVELLSLHYFHAARYEKAWEYSRAAGDRARSRYANREAVSFFERAVACAGRRDSGVRPSDLGQVLERMADAQSLMGLLDEAGTAYQRALRTCTDDPLRRGAIIAKRARIDQRVRHFRASIARLSRGLALLRGATGPAASGVRSVLQLNYGICRLGQGNPTDALSWARRALAEAEQSADPEVLALAHATIDGILVTMRTVDGVPHGEIALRMWAELGDLTGQAHCLNNIAMGAFQDYRWQEAAAGYEKAAVLFRRAGDVANDGTARFNRAELLVRQGHPVPQLLEDTLRIAEAIADDELVALVERELAGSAVNLADLDEALRWAAAARDTFLALGQDEELAGCDLVVAAALVRAGRHQDALDVTDSIELGEDPVDPALVGRRHRVRGFALLGLGRSQEAAAEFGFGRDAADGVHDRYEWALNRLGLSLADQQAAGDRASALADLRELGVVALPVDVVEQGGDHLNVALASTTNSR